MKIRDVVSKYAKTAIQRRDQAGIIAGLIGLDHKTVLDRAIGLAQRGGVSVDDILASWLRQTQAGQRPLEFKE